MKRLVHADEALRGETSKRLGLGAALAVAGLMGVSACATSASVPAYSLRYAESARMTAYNTEISAFRLGETISVMETASAPHWIEERSGGSYRSLMVVTGSERQAFSGAAFIENDGRWYFTGIIKQYGTWLRALRGENARLPAQMEMMGEDGVCKMDAEPFRRLVREVSGRDVARMKPISQSVGDHSYEGIPVTRYLVHLLPLDSEGNRIGQYRGSQLALTTSYVPLSPEFGCNRGITLLVEPEAQDPRNLQK
jgi:hypothetical protein